MKYLICLVKLNFTVVYNIYTIHIITKCLERPNKSSRQEAVVQRGFNLWRDVVSCIYSVIGMVCGFCATLAGSINKM